MTFLAAAVVVVGCLCLIDLLLTLGVVRRLREHAGLLARGELTRGELSAPPPGLAAGMRPAGFSALDTSGQVVDGPDGLQVAGFFSGSCSACPVQVAPFVDFVRSRQLDRYSVLAVVTGAEPASYVAQLSAVATVCVEPEDGAISAAFAITGFPAFFLLGSGGLIAASGYEPRSLPVPAVA
jgi:hypothetical protein